ncbi:hypothetical protein CVT25_002927 [Psilocybe cyanescens]|uniref:Uncharacterized protein n=1 Tax=Psilocybe cyanescens TaxID=93625 RepID=A0A409WMZ5_PSICY|nr:hypothetical protein CVT25_002927 [Psilocybe cyanescens]
MPDSSDREAIMATEKEIAEVEAELNALMEENPNLLGGEDVAEMLQRLTSAENMAEDMESKVDSVLQKLDELLSALNTSETATELSSEATANIASTQVKEDSPSHSSPEGNPT